MQLKKSSKKSPDLLMLSLDYPPNHGGISRLAEEIVKRLICRDYFVKVVTFFSKIYRKNENNLSFKEIYNIRGLRDYQLMRVVKNFDRNKPILATIWNPEATIALFSGAQRVTLLAHGAEMMEYKGKPLKRWVRRFVLEKARRVICNSHFTETLVLKIAPNAKTIIINPAIDTEKFRLLISKNEARKKLRLPLSKRIILTVSRLVENKGHETVINAIANLSKDEREKIFYVIVGDGDMLEKLINLTQVLGVREQVYFAGSVKDEDLIFYYNASDLFVLTTYSDYINNKIEGFGIVFLEAQAAGLAVIGTRCGGITDAIHEGEGGWLINEKDTLALVSHLKKLITNPEAIQKQGFLGLERMKREFSFDDYIRQLIELI